MIDADVFVIGGGPAGLAAAIASRRRGMRVIVADGNKPPIDKPCGEGLMPDSRRAAEAIGIRLPASIGYEYRSIRFHGAGKRVEAAFPFGRGMGVRRTVLHEILIQSAEREGVELRWNTPVSRIADVRARWIVGADGAASRVRAQADLDASVWNSRRFASRRHFGIAPWSDAMEIHWGERCQIYVTPVANDEVCIALISREPGLKLQDALERHFPMLRARLAGAAATTSERGAVTVSRRLRRVARGNVALIGDASGSVDAITGEGICLSFRQAALLADAMAAGDLANYDRAHPRLAWKVHVMAKTMLMLDGGAMVRRLGLSAMHAQPWILRRLLAVHVA
jgi:flavin-dependent dehydrogenase